MQAAIAVIIPCYRVTSHIQDVISRIGPEVNAIFCVDDACPDASGDFIEQHVNDARVRVLRHPSNLGVGGAVMTGYRAAMNDGASILIKLDGDGQMEPAMIPNFVDPILRGAADYTKGNRFWNLRDIGQMPLARRIGNIGLSFFAKASSGYWDVFDPTNGYTAIHSSVAAELPFESISERYFFETDILFRLNTLRAVVVDIPMNACYGDEVSGLKISKVIGEFLFKHVRNFSKRILYNYFLRDMSAASIELLAGMALMGFGLIFGTWHWIRSAQAETSTPVGTIMIATISIVSGLQFLLAFLNYDVAAVPHRPLHALLRRTR